MSPQLHRTCGRYVWQRHGQKIGCVQKFDLFMTMAEIKQLSDRFGKMRRARRVTQNATWGQEFVCRSKQIALQGN
jgi:hypothetical protein